ALVVGIDGRGAPVRRRRPRAGPLLPRRRRSARREGPPRRPLGGRRDGPRAVIRTAHTAELDDATRAAARALLYAAFPFEMTEEDWEHCLGGIHALAYDGGELVGHAALVQRRLLYAGRALRTGYVEGVAVHADHRRRGHGGALLAALGPFIRGGYQLGALGATREGPP